MIRDESTAIYVTGDLINEQTKISVYDPLKYQREKIVDLR